MGYSVTNGCFSCLLGNGYIFRYPSTFFPELYARSYIPSLLLFSVKDVAHFFMLRFWDSDYVGYWDGTCYEHSRYIARIVSSRAIRLGI
jgi:hypothetical protein